MKKTEYRAPALDKGLEIVELLASQEAPLATVEIATNLGRSKTEIYRMLQVLEARGYIARGEDGRYRLTDRLFILGMRRAPVRNLLEAALPIMQVLAHQIQQSCHVSVRSGDHVVAVARIESPASVGFAVQVGFQIPLLLSTSARLIYATQTPQMQAEWVEMLRQGGASQTAISQFIREAKQTAAQGYAVSESKVTDGIHDIAVPLYDGQSPGAVACLVVPYLSHRFFKTSIDDAILRVREAAAEITTALKGEPHPSRG